MWKLSIPYPLETLWSRDLSRAWREINPLADLWSDVISSKVYNPEGLRWRAVHGRAEGSCLEAGKANSTVNSQWKMHTLRYERAWSSKAKLILMCPALRKTAFLEPLPPHPSPPVRFMHKCTWIHFHTIYILICGYNFKFILFSIPTSAKKNW